MGSRLFQPDGKSHGIGSSKASLFILIRPCLPAVKAVLRPVYRSDGDCYLSGPFRRFAAVGERRGCRGQLREGYRDALYRPFLMVLVPRNLCVKSHFCSRSDSLKYISLLLFRLRPCAFIPHAVNRALCGRYGIGINLPVIGIVSA